MNHPGLKSNSQQVFYARYPVQGLSPFELDTLLKSGWSRSNRSLCFTMAHPVDGMWKASLMLRLPLKGFNLKKRLRKLYRLNDQRFLTVIRPFENSAKKESLWQTFKGKVHHWKVVPPLDVHLFNTKNPIDFQSWEVEVYDGDRLIAFSVFDKGVDSIASLEAAYDFEYEKFIPGIYTLLAEIKYAQERNIGYYYPGFIPKNTPMFEYKLRLGRLEFFRIKTREWLPWELLEPGDWVFDEVLEKLRMLQAVLNGGQRNSLLAAGYFVNRPGESPSLLNYNIFLLCSGAEGEQRDLRIAFCWDPFAAHFKVFEARLVTNIQHDYFTLTNRMVIVYDIPESILKGSFISLNRAFHFFPPGCKEYRS